MPWPTPILRATRPLATPAPISCRTALFTYQDASKLFACPYCGQRFYSLGGQARHISQTECRFRERAWLDAERVKRSFEFSLDLSSDNGHVPKRVRFAQGDVTVVLEAATPAERASETPIPPPCANNTIEPVLPAEPHLFAAHEPPPATSSQPSAGPSTAQPGPTISSQERVIPPLYTCDGGKTFIEPYPDPLAGSPINSSLAPPFDLHAYIQSAGPLSNIENFNDLELLMTVGLTDKGRDRMLKSRAYEGRTPWRNCEQMLKALDALPHGPKWDMYEIEIEQVNGEIRVEYLFGRNIVDIVRSLIGDWSFKDELHYAPVQVWTTKERKERVYSEAWTANWWWRMQIIIRDKFATIVPLIIATDMTNLSVMCGGQVAYPVYVTIGNIPKSVRRKVNRRATVLLGYLPVDNFSEVTNPEERARLKHQLTHDAMTVLMEPLKRAAKEGVVMTCADGRQRRVYPIPAAFEGDWPEQCGMACAEECGCPVCEQMYDQRGDYPNMAPNRNPNDTLSALRSYLRNDRDPGELRALRLKPWWPWWASIPYTNFHTSITPDLLHQLYQGMIKSHAVKWVKKVVKTEVVDRCFKAMPGAVGLRYFARGISKVKQWTGRESKEVAKQLLPVVAGHKHINPDFVSVIRSILDFTFRAHQSQMTEGELERLEQALASFHLKKTALVTVGIYDSLARLNRIKKLHMLTHYGYAIREMGTPDGYNTESPEHLHIIYAKRGWRSSNKVRPLPQMTKLVQRMEAIRIHRTYIDLYYGCPDRERGESRVVYGEDEDAISDAPRFEQQVEDDEGAEEEVEEVGEVEEVEEAEEEDSDDEEESEQVKIQPSTQISRHVVDMDPEWSMGIRAAAPQALGDNVINTYTASEFDNLINEWLEESIASGLLPRGLQPVTRWHTFDVWHKFYLHHRRLHFDPDQPPHRDTIRAKPPAQVREGSSRPAGPGKFDTVLFLAQPNEFGIHRYRAGRIKVIFKLPAHLRDAYPHPLVYVELFTPFTKNLADCHRMHTIAPDMHRGLRRAAVMPLVWVVAACHLVPRFDQFDDDFPFHRHDILSVGKDFFFNHYSNHFMFGMVDHWRAIKARLDEAKAAEDRAAVEEATRTNAARAKAARARLVQIRKNTGTARE